jgi:hypothetical protein
MNTLKFLTSLVFVSIFFVSCSNDDDSPEIVNEEEVITTMTITLTPVGGGEDVILQTKDLDGDGGNDPIITPTQATLIAGKTYNGSIVLLNETEEPAENITEEVEEEDDEHQFFYTISGDLDVNTAYANFDGNGDPLGTEFTIIANSASTGSINFTLRHEPTKPNNGLVDAGGSTDISTTFSLEVQ